MKAFWSVAQCLAQGESSQVQICGKNVRPHPCGEVQLTLHLPTKRQRGTRLSSGDSRVNPNLAVWRGPGPLIYQKDGTTNKRPGKQTREGRRADGQGEGRAIQANPDSLIPTLLLVLPDFLSPSVTLALTCLCLARPLALVQLLLLPPHNNRNLQK